MRKIGIYATLIGLALIILPYFGLTLRLFGMIDELGETPAWAIKIGLVVVGVILYFLGGANSTSEVAKQNTESEA
ncbi:hypothetical protein [Winogradskyella jejuensis]|uniref:Uncharacterized protein n=1 Tax=Winogradskyella jejuensis TaxID=1089305 RepID=A0A1M5L307_9FLAO|nr:hypothetical protein [Winogradskyella jejuensis]SHG59484.1 hypothetical protein SAMN05444148_0511 [Winogradskyella jejuensis]